jgi:hypothetical protein
MVLATRYIQEIRVAEREKFDLTGFVLAGTALSTSMFGLEMGSRGVGSGTLTAALLATGTVTALLYWRQSRPQAQPILDFRLMRIPTFRISVISGTLSRIAVGAVPFLLPMMLQLGFGMTAARSGTITLAGSIGSLAMRSVAPALLRRIGFRNTLVWVGLLSTCLLGTSATFRPWWPVEVMFGILVFGGFVQSLQFMAYNTIAYADVPMTQMSSATAFYTTFQQLSLSLGIGVSAAVLAASVALAGHNAPLPSDFSVAFVAVAGVALFAPLISTGLTRDAGNELTGHARPARG